MGDPQAALEAVYELRYRGQSFELALAAGTEATPDELRGAFEREHEERYGYHDSEQQLELVTIRVTATAAAVEVDLAQAGEQAELESSRREATLAGERIELSVLRGVPSPGAEIEGPAVVELPESTVLIPPGWDAKVDETGTILMTRSR